MIFLNWEKDGQGSYSTRFVEIGRERGWYEATKEKNNWVLRLNLDGRTVPVDITRTLRAAKAMAEQDYENRQPKAEVFSFAKARSKTPVRSAITVGLEQKLGVDAAKFRQSLMKIRDENNAKVLRRLNR